MPAKRPSAFFKAVQEAQQGEDALPGLLNLPQKSPPGAAEQEEDEQGGADQAPPISGAKESQQDSMPVNQEDSLPGRQQNSMLVSQHASKPAKQYAGKPARQYASKPVSQQIGAGLVKATFYLTEDDIMQLEHIRLSRRSRGVKMDKSALVREAIHLLKP